MKIKRRWKVCMFAGILTTLTMVGGVMAYFTDTESQTNTFTVGKIAIDLREDDWDSKPDENANDIPDEAENMCPMQTITKDPRIENTGINDAYVFMTVETPYKNLVTANADGTKNAATDTALYSYTVNPNWLCLGSKYTYDENDNKETEIKLYAYADENGECLTLTKEAITNTLFDSVTMANVIEGQNLEEQIFNIPINAYAIQTTDLNGGKTQALDVWNIVANQNDVENSFQ